MSGSLISTADAGGIAAVNQPLPRIRRLQQFLMVCASVDARCKHGEEAQEAGKGFPTFQPPSYNNETQLRKKSGERMDTVH